MGSRRARESRAPVPAVGAPLWQPPLPPLSCEPPPQPALGAGAQSAALLAPPLGGPSPSPPRDQYGYLPSKNVFCWGTRAEIIGTLEPRASTIPNLADLSLAQCPALPVLSRATSSGQTPSCLPWTPLSHLNSRVDDITSMLLLAETLKYEAAAGICDLADARVRGVRRPTGEVGTVAFDNKWLSYHRALLSLNETGIG